MFKVEYHGYEAWKRSGTRFGVYYDKQADEKRQIASIFIKEAKKLGIDQPFNCPLGCVSIFYKRYPKAWSEKKRKENIFWDTKPDSDNMEKFIFDALERQAGLIENDSKICAKLCLKLWGAYDYTVFFMDKWTDSSRFIFNNNCVGFNGVGYRFMDRVFFKY